MSDNDEDDQPAGGDKKRRGFVGANREYLASLPSPPPGSEEARIREALMHTTEEHFSVAYGPMNEPLLPSSPPPPATPGPDALQRIEAKLDEVIGLLRLLEKRGQKGTGE